MTTQNHITVSTLEHYDPAIAAGLSQLAQQLDPAFTSHVSEAHFNQYFRDSSERSILIAERAGTLLGTAVMHVMVEQTPDSLAGYMGGFVVDEAERGSGAAIALWSGMKRWCRERDLASFAFNTETSRERAVKFYERMGAVLLEGTDSHYTVSTAESAVPDTALYGFLGHQHAEVAPIEKGRVNRTFIVASGTNKTVLQRMNTVFDERLIDDAVVISTHVAKHGWQTAAVLQAQNSTYTLRDEAGNLWRHLSYIESDEETPAMYSTETLADVGGMLARWHHTLAALDYAPQFQLPHFHDTPYYAARLKAQLGSMPDAETSNQAQDILASYTALPPLPAGAAQLIHGDPQLSNVIFQDRKPVTYIDLDTTMPGSIWLDIGDLIRSTLEHELETSGTVPLEKVYAISDGYYAKSKQTIDASEFRRSAMTAAKHIALELAMRFMNDIVDDNYFAWDETQFQTRRDNHRYRAGLQQRIVAGLHAHHTEQAA